MARQSVYVETTIVSYLTGRPSRDLVVAGKQQVTADWWETERHGYDLFVSEFVAKEAAEDDPEAAERRSQCLAGIAFVEANPDVATLAEALLIEGVLPEKAATDAVHIALATVHGIDFLLTWNCKHLANARIRDAVNRVLVERGYEPPIICTPDELMGE
ncbi:MAG: type II toxin-antitoxin system VapC family toxin [Planctomycetota bacterium]